MAQKNGYGALTARPFSLLLIRLFFTFPKKVRCMQLSSRKVLLVGGKGGVGKTTVSSSLAMLAAKSGKKVLLVSTDPAHSLSDVFNMDIGDRLHHVSDNLTVMEIDPDKEVKEHVARVSSQMKRYQPDLFPEINGKWVTQQSRVRGSRHARAHLQDY